MPSGPLVLATLLFVPLAAYAADTDVPPALVRHDCLICHAVDEPKTGPAFVEEVLEAWGSAERFMPLSGIGYFLEDCDDVRVITFNHVGHWVQLERTDEFNRYSLAFLNG